MVHLDEVLSLCAICRFNIDEREKNGNIDHVTNNSAMKTKCLQVLDSVDVKEKKKKLQKQKKDNGLHIKMIPVLNYIRQNIATYQEKRGISPNQEYNFLSMLHTIGENLYNVIIVMTTMFANLLPIVDIFFLIVRFVVEKLIEIVESTGNDKIMKALIFVFESVALIFVIMFICGFVLSPLISMIFMFSNKFYAFLFG